MALPASDDFDDATDYATLTSRTNWTSIDGQHATYAGHVYGGASGQNCDYWDADAFSDAQYSECDIFSIRQFYLMGVSVFCHASTADYYAFYGDSDNSYIDEIVSGVGSTLAGGLTALATNDTVKLTTSVSAGTTTLEAFINDVSETSTTDTTRTSGSAGLAGTNDAGDSYGVDNWVGDDISVGGINYDRTLSDSVSVSDQQQAYEDKLRMLVSAVEISDLIGSDKILSRLIFDGININDSIQSIVATIFERILSSSIEVNDSVSVQKHIERLLIDTVVIFDNILQDKNLCRMLHDNVVLTDAIISSVLAASQTYNRILSDSVLIQDAIVREITELVRGYILMALKEEKIEIATKNSSIKTNTSESNIETDTRN